MTDKADQKIQVRVQLSPNDPLWERLSALGIEADDDSDYILSRRRNASGYLSCKKDDRIFYLPISQIIYIDSLGHDVRIHTRDGVYMTKERLKQLEFSLDPDLFLRVSNSAIIAVKKIQKIEASLLQKFILHMTNGDKVDVTRSYYYIFKERFQI